MRHSKILCKKHFLKPIIKTKNKARLTKMESFLLNTKLFLQPEKLIILKDNFIRSKKLKIQKKLANFWNAFFKNKEKLNKFPLNKKKKKIKSKSKKNKTISHTIHFL